MGLVLCAAVLASLAAAAAGFISDDALHTTPHGTTGRRLLQIKKNCPVNFETANYTVVTSRCKGPVYNDSVCCVALKDLACQYEAYINDLTTSCAATMLSYLTLNGRYPSGLFANTCKEHLIKGIRCPDELATNAAAGSSVALLTTTYTFYMYYILIQMS